MKYIECKFSSQRMTCVTWRQS